MRAPWLAAGWTKVPAPFTQPSRRPLPGTTEAAGVRAGAGTTASVVSARMAQPFPAASIASMTTAKPRVLIVYFTYTQQSRRVADAMADVFLERGCDVRQGAIELTDRRYVERFSRFPLRHAFLDVLGMMPAQVRGGTGEIRIPEEAQGDYDLICVGSPTWWLKPSVPIRSFLMSDAAGPLLRGKRFTAF